MPSQVDQFVDFFNIMMYECATSGSRMAAECRNLLDPTNPTHGVQPGGAATRQFNIFLQEGVAPHSSTWAPLSTVISIQMCRNYLENARPQTRRKTEPARAFRLTTTEPFQTANQSKGLHTYYDPIALVRICCAWTARRGSSRTTTRFRLTPRVVLRLAVESGRSVHVVD